MATLVAEHTNEEVAAVALGTTTLPASAMQVTPTNRALTPIIITPRTKIINTDELSL
ncbi:MAG: hypothetical protein ACPG9L_05430 [Crocinitomicaceae bacterium]